MEEEACQQMSWHSGFTSKEGADSRQRVNSCGLNPPRTIIRAFTRFPDVSKYISEIQETIQWSEVAVAPLWVAGQEG